MNTSTSKAVKGWNNTFAPKSLNIKVSEWLAENDFSNEDVECVDEDATFADFKECLDGGYVDLSKMNRLCDGDYMDTFLRDAIYDAIDAID